MENEVSDEAVTTLFILLPETAYISTCDFTGQPIRVISSPAIRVSGALLPEIPTEEIAVGSIREKVALVIP